MAIAVCSDSDVLVNRRQSLFAVDARLRLCAVIVDVDGENYGGNVEVSEYGVDDSNLLSFCPDDV